MILKVILNINYILNILFFIINLILSIIIAFCGCVYSELFIIYHFNLERDTHIEISERATIVEDIIEEKDNLVIN